eukprot:gene8404-6067_t
MELPMAIVDESASAGRRGVLDLASRPAIGLRAGILRPSSARAVEANVPTSYAVGYWPLVYPASFDGLKPVVSLQLELTRGSSVMLGTIDFFTSAGTSSSGWSSGSVMATVQLSRPGLSLNAAVDAALSSSSVTASAMLSSGLSEAQFTKQMSLFVSTFELSDTVVRLSAEEVRQSLLLVPHCMLNLTMTSASDMQVDMTSRSVNTSSAVTLVVCNGRHRWRVASKMVEIRVTASRHPVITILTRESALTQVNGRKDVTIKANVMVRPVSSAARPSTASWSLLTASTVADPSVSLVGMTKDNQTSLSWVPSSSSTSSSLTPCSFVVSLQLRAQALQSGGYYLFRLACEEATADVAVTVNAAPFRRDGSLWFIANVLLPPGLSAPSFVLPIRCVVSDALEGTGIAYSNATVRPMNGSLTDARTIEKMIAILPNVSASSSTVAFQQVANVMAALYRREIPSFSVASAGSLSQSLVLASTLVSYVNASLQQTDDDHMSVATKLLAMSKDMVTDTKISIAQIQASEALDALKFNTSGAGSTGKNSSAAESALVSQTLSILGLLVQNLLSSASGSDSSSMKVVQVSTGILKLSVTLVSLAETTGNGSAKVFLPTVSLPGSTSTKDTVDPLGESMGKVEPAPDGTVGAALQRASETKQRAYAALKKYVISVSPSVYHPATQHAAVR